MTAATSGAASSGARRLPSTQLTSESATRGSSPQPSRAATGAQPGGAGWVVLELGVTRPPAGVQAPRGPPDRDGVIEAVELSRVVVEDEEAAAERRPAERDGVCEKQEGGRQRAAHGCR